MADIPDAAMEGAYAAALRHVLYSSCGRGDEYTDVLLDAATDGIIWARDRYDPARGPFGAFAGVAMRRCVRRAMIAHGQRVRPMVYHMGTREEADLQAQPDAVPMLIGDLPDDIAFAVRLYMVDGYDLRDCGLLLGAGPNAVQRMLRKAGMLLAPGRVVPVRRAGERRLGRTSHQGESR